MIIIQFLLSTIYKQGNLVIFGDVLNLSYVKVGNKSEKTEKMSCEQLAVQSWHSVHNAMDVNTANDYCIQIIVN